MTDLLEREPDIHRRDANTASRSARIGWLIPGAILAVATLGWGTVNVLSLVAHGEYTTSTTFDATDVASISISNDNGAVDVVASAREGADTILVTADVSDGWRPTSITMDVVDGVLRLGGDCPILGSPWCAVDFTVEIPEDRAVRIDGSNGSIRVDGVASQLDISNDNGSIELVGVTGPITVSSDNGRITGRGLSSDSVVVTNENGSVDLAFVEPPSSVSARVANGRLELVLPDDVAYRVDARSDNGRVDNSVRTDPSSDHVIDATASNGSITIRLPD